MFRLCKTTISFVFQIFPLCDFANIQCKEDISAVRSVIEWLAGCSFVTSFLVHWEIPSLLLAVQHKRNMQFSRSPS